jgi:hypothetical protein
MFLLAGPEPMQGGNITMHEYGPSILMAHIAYRSPVSDPLSCRFFLGRWDDGRHFGQVYNYFEKRVRAPFLRFAEHAFRKSDVQRIVFQSSLPFEAAEERIRRALPDTELLVNYVPEEGLGEVLVTSSLVQPKQQEAVKETRDHRSKRSMKKAAKKPDNPSEHSQDSSSEDSDETSTVSGSAKKAGKKRVKGKRPAHSQDSSSEDSDPASTVLGSDDDVEKNDKSEPQDDDQESVYETSGRGSTARNEKLRSAGVTKVRTWSSRFDKRCGLP